MSEHLVKITISSVDRIEIEEFLEQLGPYGPLQKNFICTKISQIFRSVHRLKHQDEENSRVLFSLAAPLKALCQSIPGKDG